MVTADGVVKILDFGLAKLAGAAAITRTGSSVGTPAYMSPEQARGEDVDPRTDLWSLRRRALRDDRRPPPVPRRARAGGALRHPEREPKPLAELRPEAPPELERIVDGLLAKDPGDRYPTAEGPLADLRALRGQTMTTTVRHPAGPPRAVPASALDGGGRPGSPRLSLVGGRRPHLAASPAAAPTPAPLGLELHPAHRPGGPRVVPQPLAGRRAPCLREVGERQRRHLSCSASAAATRSTSPPTPRRTTPSRPSRPTASRSPSAPTATAAASSSWAPRGSRSAASPTSATTRPGRRTASEIVFATEGVSRPLERRPTASSGASTCATGTRSRLVRETTPCSRAGRPTAGASPTGGCPRGARGGCSGRCPPAAGRPSG